MILSRHNLIIHKMTKQDKAIPILDNVHFREDGMSVATNGMSVVAVSPVCDRMKQHVIINDTWEGKNITVSSESVKEALKNLPKDIKYAGVLEHCVLEKKKSGKTRFNFSDGKRDKSIDVKVFSKDYTNYQEVFKEAYINSRVEGSRKIAVNLSRFLSVISVINKVCPDSANETPLFIEITEKGDFIFRCTNTRSGQQIVSIMKAYKGTEGKIPELSEWEKGLFDHDSSDNTDNDDNNISICSSDPSYNTNNKTNQGCMDRCNNQANSVLGREQKKRIKKIKRIEGLNQSLRDVNLKLRKNSNEENLQIKKLKKKLRRQKYENKIKINYSDK